MAKKTTRSTGKRKSGSTKTTTGKTESTRKNISERTSTMKIVVPVTSAYVKESVETKPMTVNENTKRSSSEKGKNKA